MLVGVPVLLNFRVQASSIDLPHEGTSLVWGKLTLLCQMRKYPQRYKKI